MGNSLYRANTVTRENTHSHLHTAETQSQRPLFTITFVTKELEENTAPLALIKENHIL